MSTLCQQYEYACTYPYGRQVGEVLIKWLPGGLIKASGTLDSISLAETEARFFFKLILFTPRKYSQQFFHYRLQLIFCIVSCGWLAGGFPYKNKRPLARL